MNKKSLLKKYLQISDFYGKPFPYSLFLELGFNKDNIPKEYKLFKDYIFSKDIKKFQAYRLNKSYCFETQYKTKLAKNYLFTLYLLPFVYMIGISGSVAMKTPNKEDDIDIFILCDQQSLWLTRLIDFIFYTIIGKRRTHILKNKKLENKLCINKYQSLQRLQINEKDIYTALQIISISPIWGKKLKNQMLDSNKWVTKYYSNLSKQSLSVDLLFILKRTTTILLYPILIPTNLIAKILQINILKKNSPDSYHYDNYTIETYSKIQSNKLKTILNKES
ncbi:MAG TPA: hypothetical protein PK957_02195 [Candidatus Dojkabacteria bacterium]|nr:hypothetical protein [Candidatus Dojkabacteria bacterium]HQF36673.1 hypothetical protein [Candidatus Dojkabacteria bacterium]